MNSLYIYGEGAVPGSYLEIGVDFVEACEGGSHDCLLIILIVNYLNWGNSPAIRSFTVKKSMTLWK